MWRGCGTPRCLRTHQACGEQGDPGDYTYCIFRCNFSGGKQLRARSRSNPATRCAGIGEVLGDPCRACGTSTIPSAEPVIRRTRRPSPRAAASGPASAADPAGLHRSNTTQQCGTPLGAHTGGAATSSRPRSSGCEAQTAVRFSPPRDGSLILVDLYKLLI
jgi:hypothetical protein